MSFSLVKVIPDQVVTIGDDVKNRSSNLFDQSLDTRWSFKGDFAYNIIRLKESVELDSITFHWYMKKKERRIYKFAVHVTENDVNLGGEKLRDQVQQIHDDAATVRSSNESGFDSTTVQLNGKRGKTIIVIYTYSSSKKRWFSVKEIEIMGRTSISGARCPDGYKWDSILGECKKIMEDTDEGSIDGNGVMFWEDEVGSYLSEDHTFSRNFRTDGSMSFDFELKDMGGKWRASKEIVLFLKPTAKSTEEGLTYQTDGGGHSVFISYDMIRAVLYHGETEDAIDISKLNLPSMTGMFYGICITDRLVVNELKAFGRIVSIRVNPNPFDYNRNVQNDSWIDIAAFLDTENPLFEPPGTGDHKDSIIVDGQNASIFGFRFLRYCEVEPIRVENEEEMQKVFAAIREDTDDEVPQTTNLGNVNAKVVPQIFVKEEGELVTLSATIADNPLVTRVQWRQSSGMPISIPVEELNKPVVKFKYKKDYGNTEWTFSCMAQGGITVFEQSVKIIEAINISKDYLYPIRPDATNGFQYAKNTNLKLEAAELFGYYDKKFRNPEITAVMNIPKQNVAAPYVITVGPFKYEIYSDGKYTGTESTYNYMVNIPSFKGKKIGLKVIVQQTNWMNQKDEKQRITLTEVYLNLSPDDKTFEYSPWFKVIQPAHDESMKIEFSVPATTKFETVEVREIHPESVIRNL